MGGFIRRDIKRVETTAFNTTINKEIFDSFKDYCKETGYPMNVMLETFMQQYINGRFNAGSEDILKWKKDSSEIDNLNTTLNKEIYMNFKYTCKSNGFFVKHVLTAFMEEFIDKNLILEYVDASKIKQE